MSQVGGAFVTAVPAVPAGSVQAFAGSSAPNGWLLCDGTAVSRTTYSSLFSVVSTTFGVGDGSTTFNVPDLRGRVPMGAGTGAQNGGTGSGVITGGTALTARTRGAFGGDERLMAHNHLGGMGTAVGAPTTGAMGTRIIASSTTTYENHSTVVQAAGTGASENMPPFVVVNYIIKWSDDVPRGGMTASWTPPIVTTLPVSPSFGDQVVYAADATNGVYWLLQYDASGTYPWKFVGGAPLTASAVGTFTSPPTGSTSTYVNSGLSGSPTITAPLAGDYITRVNASAKTSNSSPAPGVFISYASALPSNWEYSDSLASGGAASSYVLSAQKRGTVTAASQAIALVWTNANTAGTVSFYSIYMSATPIRVKAA